jgi:type I restriction enzyme S subunit
MKANGWKSMSLDAIALMSQYGLSCPASADGGVPMLRMNNLTADGKLDTSDLVYVRLSNDELEKYRLQKGDLLFNRTNSYELVGKTTLFELDEDYVFASYLIRFKLDPKLVDPRFVSYFFNTDQSKDCLRKLASKGVSQSNINPTILKERFLVPVPPLPAQTEIAETLRCWDRAIEQTEKLITAKTRGKRGLMQQLLSRRKRFTEFKGLEWKSMRISDFSQLTLRGILKPDKPFKSLGIRSHGKGTFLKEDFEPEKIELTELYEVKENDLIVNITFAWEGAIAIAGAQDSGSLVSHRFPTYVFDTARAIPEYFRHVIVQKWFIEKLGLISPGGAGRNRVLSKKDFAKLEVLMPPLEEQYRIAAVLNACDKEITLLKHQLDALKRQKRGLMRKLLTGQIRVKAELRPID